MAFKVQIIEQKNSKRNLKRIFEEYRVIVQNCFFLDQTPSNYVGRIRSNYNFEVILKVKKAKKNAKLWKIAKLFLAFFGKYTGHRGLKFCTVPYLTSIYTFLYLA